MIPAGVWETCCGGAQALKSAMLTPTETHVLQSIRISDI
jgi:hypothetical protein